MLTPFRTLRFRLTLLFVVVFGAIQLLVWSSIDFLLAKHLRQRFDDEVIERTEAVVESIENIKKRAATESDASVLADVMRAFEARDVFIEAHLADSGETVRSGNMRGASFPLPERRDTDARIPMLTTIEDEGPPHLARRGDKLRLATVFLDDERYGPTSVRVAMLMTPLERIIADMHQLLIIFNLVSLVVAGGVSWFMAGKSMAPISQIARKARRISAKRLNERIPVPPTQDDVAELVKIINHMLDRLEHEFKNQQSFISNVSHELKTPLTVLLGEAQTLRRRASAMTASEADEFITAVEEEARQLLRIVESFLILARARRGGVLEVARPVSMEDVALQAVADCRSTAAQHQVRVIPQLPEISAGHEPVVLGDEDLLRAMVENLVANAVRHSPAGATVEIEVAPNARDVSVFVRDRGAGIPVAQRERIFDPYVQLAPDKRHGKVGIGLSIVKSVAALHLGDVTVSERDGGGSEFLVRLPIAREA